VTVCSSRAPSPMAAIQRSRLWASVAASSQAALAASRPEAGGPDRRRLEVADRRLADGMAALVGVEPGGGADAVGDNRVVAPGREQLLLVIQVAGPPHDQPVAVVGVSGTCGTPPGR
jgi:hypothetical protein